MAKGMYPGEAPPEYGVESTSHVYWLELSEQFRLRASGDVPLESLQKEQALWAQRKFPDPMSLGPDLPAGFARASHMHFTVVVRFDGPLLPNEEGHSRLSDVLEKWERTFLSVGTVFNGFSSSTGSGSGQQRVFSCV